ncbi:Protein ECERIFERUM like [Heracleum sosnowskyi]|uniref:Protein ECERIFERUM like n=1 Tax=Heracleum sosnowskyi TaxID=360622 RepID=A0AAD8M768_9APIA|nr:Protein ECERIFERUM like [Heracleum sosnowskyi]
MATNPGILTDWPWTPLGSYKYVVLAPFVVHSTYSFITKDENERDLGNFLILPFLLWRMLHNQIWISLSRYRTAKGNNRIVDKTIEFEQVDRERNWDDQILFNGILYYLVNLTSEGASNQPLWRTDGFVITTLLHVGPVEFIYYWLHRALHHHYLYSRYHSHHHSSIVTEPITSVIHPFAEHISYFLLFAIPLMTVVMTGTGSIALFFTYITFVDFMNNLGHCNFELIPAKLFSIFPPLKYIMYTPSYHSLHHTQFRTNYSLFMPFYDYMYGTMDKSTDTLYETSLKREEESANVVHLTHLTTPESIYHLRLGFAYLASKPQSSSQWYMWLMWPVTLWSMIVTWFYGQTFVVQRNIFKTLNLQTWVIPRYTVQYTTPKQRESINCLIEEAIVKAERKGTMVLTLGLLNQGEEMNNNGELFIRRHPQLKVKLVDGSSLAVAIVLNSIPKGATQVAIKGNLSKVSNSIAIALCRRGVQVSISCEYEYRRLKETCDSETRNNLVLSDSCSQQVWLVGDELGKTEQMKASKGTLIIPFSQFPPKKLRKDCFYCNTPAMSAPRHLQNLDSCENWLPRRVMSAWRIAGIVHALEGWNVHECGNMMFSIDKIWKAALEQGFRPLPVST